MPFSQGFLNKTGAYLFGMSILILSGLTSPLKAQPDGRCRQAEDSILLYLQQINQATSDEEKLDLNVKISAELTNALNSPGSFDYSFDSLKTVGRLYAPDKSFRVITWNVSLNMGVYKHFGILQVPLKDNSYKIFQLTDRTNDISNPENSVLSAGKWFGALYYKILKNKIDNRNYYTLLALQYHNAFTTRKIVEVLYFDEWSNPVFGAPIIKVGENLVRHRLVFEYSALTTMILRYDEKLKLIIFDHLSPSDKRFNGQFAYYGPDLTFDGLAFQKKQWVYRSGLDLRINEEPRKPQKPISRGIFPPTATKAR